MPRATLPAIDRIGVGLSGLCVVHCVLSVLLVSVLSLAHTVFADPIIHRVGLAGATLLALVALGQGYRRHRAIRPVTMGAVGIALMAGGLLVPHGMAEVALTVAGVSIVAVSHLMNARLAAARR